MFAKFGKKDGAPPSPMPATPGGSVDAGKLQAENQRLRNMLEEAQELTNSAKMVAADAAGQVNKLDKEVKSLQAELLAANRSMAAAQAAAAQAPQAAPAPAAPAVDTASLARIVDLEKALSDLKSELAQAKAREEASHILTKASSTSSGVAMEEFNTLKTANAVLEERLAEATKKEARLAEAVSAAEKEAADRMAEIATLRSERDALSRNAGASDSVAASSSAHMEVLEKQRAALQAAKDAAEAEAERMSAQVIQAQSSARAFEAEATRLRAEAAALEAKVAEARSAGAEGGAAGGAAPGSAEAMELADLRQQVSALKAEMAAMTARVADAEGLAEIAKSEGERTARKLAAATEAAAAAESALGQKAAEAAAANSKANGAEERVGMLEIDKTSLQARVNALQAEIASLKRDTELLEDARSAAHRRATELEGQLEGKEAALAAAEADRASLAQKVTEVMEEAAARQSKLEGLRSAEEALEQANGTIAALRSASDDANVRAASLQQRLAAAESEMRESLAAAEAAKEGMQGTIAQLQGAMQGLDAEIAAVSQRAEDREREAAEALRRVQEEAGEVAQLKGEVERLGREAAAREAAAAAAAAESAQAVSTLRENLDSTRGALAAAQSDLSDSRGEIGQLSARVAQLEADLSASQSQLSAAQSALEQSQADAADLRQRLSALEADLEASRAQGAALAEAEQAAQAARAAAEAALKTREEAQEALSAANARLSADMELRVAALRKAIMEKREARRMLVLAKARHGHPTDPDTLTNGTPSGATTTPAHVYEWTVRVPPLTVSHPPASIPQGSIRVMCRVRPPTGDEASDPRARAQMVQVNTATDSSDVVLTDPRNAHGEKTIEFDGIFAADLNQQSVYDKLASLANVAMDGSNAAVFAYGPKGAGKTHSMNGTDFERGLNEYFGRGLLKALGEMGDLFDSWSLDVSAVALLPNSVHDLLGVSAAQDRSVELEPGADVATIPDLSQRSIKSVKDLEMILAMAMKGRDQACAAKRETVDHASIMVTFRPTVASTVLRMESTGKLVLVELAAIQITPDDPRKGGSASISGAPHTQPILALEDVLAAAYQNSGPVPFRASPLTKLLMDCVGDDGTCVLLAHTPPLFPTMGEGVAALKVVNVIKKRTTHLDDPGSTPRRLKNPLNLISDIHTANVNAVQKVTGDVGGVVKGVGSGMMKGFDKLNPLHLGKKG